MNSITPNLTFFINLAKVQAVISRRLDSGLNGLGFTEFIILFHLDQAENGKMRRTDLAEKIGLTASGVTRLLLPMEKIGLIKREADATDARVSFVTLAPGGKRKLHESLERAELFVEEWIPEMKVKRIEQFSETLSELAASVK